MKSPACLVKRNTDGSLEVWVGEVGIYFPKDGRPTVLKGQAPDGAAQSDPNVAVRYGDQGTAVTGNGRMVLIRPDGSTVIASDELCDGPANRFRLRMRRARD